MINYILRKSAVFMLALCSLFLAACSTFVPGSGPPASEAQMREIIAGKSFNLFDQQVYFAGNGTYKRIGPSSEMPFTCLGSWSVSGSYLITDYTCKEKEGGRINSATFEEKLQGRIHKVIGGGVDLVNEAGEGVGSLELAFRHDGFPREAEFNAVREQLGF
jgi:hypothetical protein